MSEPKRRVLLIDDEAAILKIMGRLLQLSGFEVVTSPDGEDGLAKAQTGHPDVVVLDLMLPKMNGYDVCATLKRDQATKTIPIVIFTAGGQQQEPRCRELGADAFFNKTDPASELIALLKSMLHVAE